MLRRHLNYANVMSCLALFLVLAGGTVYAAGAFTGDDVVDESLTGADVADGSIRGEDVRDTTLSWHDLAPATIGSSRVVNDSLTGTDVLESSFGKVGDADTLDGKDSTELVEPTEDWRPVLDTFYYHFAEIDPEAAYFGGGWEHGCHEQGVPCPWDNATADNPAAFYKDPAGVVHLRGAVLCTDPEGAYYPCDNLAVMLPESASPATTKTFTAWSCYQFRYPDEGAECGAVRVTVDPEGLVRAFLPVKGHWPAAATNLSLDGISFRAGG